MAWSIYTVSIIQLDSSGLARCGGSPLKEIVSPWERRQFSNALAIAVHTGFIYRLKGHLTNRLTWTGISYLFLRFPLGIGKRSE